MSDLIEVYKILQGVQEMGRGSFFAFSHNIRIQRHLKLTGIRIRVEKGSASYLNESFSCRIHCQWMR